MDLAPGLTAPQGSACVKTQQGFFSRVGLPPDSTCNSVLKATTSAFKITFLQVEVLLESSKIIHSLKLKFWSFRKQTFFIAALDAQGIAPPSCAYRNDRSTRYLYYVNIHIHYISKKCLSYSCFFQ